MMLWLARMVAASAAALTAASASVPTLAPPITYFGMCDASAAVALGADSFVVANDEDNVIRVYRRQPPALPTASFDLSAFLNLSPGPQEADLEGAARVGNRVYWIASHGRDAKGNFSPNRHRFFATVQTIAGGRVAIRPVGRPYGQLLEDLFRDPRLRPFALDRASLLAPKLPGALDIEGLVAMPDGRLLIGFRNPIPRGRALLIPLRNPAALIRGAHAQFDAPILLDLGGLGVRSLGWSNGRYFVIAGPYGDEAVSRLYEWAGPGATPVLVDSVNFAGSNPEGVAFESAKGLHDFFVLSDDGRFPIDGVDCKRLNDPAKQRFRAYQLLF